MANNKIGTKRTILASDGQLSVFQEQESHYSELIKQLLLNAGYNGIPISKYELLDNSYRASGGFETGKYLIPHTSEKEDKYIRRKNMSYFINYVKPVVDAHVNPIFKTEPIRSGMSQTFSLFLDDVDGNNTSLTRFMKKAAIRAKLHGVEFIVVDMEKIESDKIITKKDVVEERLYPYLYLVSPSQVLNWYTDKFGKLVSITYSITNNVIDENGDVKNTVETWTWTNTICKRVINEKQETFQNPIGIIPIIPLYGAINDSSELIPQSDVYAIARTNFALYNACSELRERNRAQAFSLLTYPIAEDDDYESGDEPIKYGTADCLLYRAESGAEPKFITPPPDSSEILLDEINSMVREIYRMANLRMSTDKNTYNVSALARKIENQQYYQSIAELAQGLEEAEKKIYRIFNKYAGDKSEGYEVHYNREYAVLDVTEVLNSATISLALGMTEDYNVEMRKQVARAVLADTSAETLSEIIDSIDKSKDSGDALETQATVIQPTRS